MLVTAALKYNTGSLASRMPSGPMTRARRAPKGAERRGRPRRDLSPLMQSGNDVTGTDWEFFLKLDQEFHFGCDMAALQSNAKVTRYIGPDHEDPARRDCLTIEWPTDRPNWLNPPYSKAYLFVKKAAEQRQRGVTTVLLLASRTDTRWFHEFIWDAENEGCREGVEIRFVRRRLKFQGHTNAAPFPSMLVIMRPTEGGKRS